jgi:hypothetical protein
MAISPNSSVIRPLLDTAGFSLLQYVINTSREKRRFLRVLWVQRNVPRLLALPTGACDIRAEIMTA